MSILHEESTDNGRGQYRPVFEKLFKKTGKQGIVGICHKDGKKQVFKISRYINYTSVHEYNIMRSLDRLHQFCPFFCRTTGLEEIRLSPKFRDQANPLALGKGHAFRSHVLYAEIIKGKSLSSLIKNKSVAVRVILSAMRQTLGAISIAQQEEQFTHYDLHSSNILMEPCEQDSIALFITQQGAIQTPTYGARPKIIDYGFSYAKTCRKKRICCSLAHTDIGFLSHIHDPFADARLLLITLAYEAKLHHPNNKHMKLFRRVVKDLYKVLPTDPSSGWDKGYREVSAVDSIMEVTDSMKPQSEIFDRYNHFSLDIVQHMIKLPLRRKPFKDLSLAFKVIDEEMHKLSTEMGSDFFNLYMFRKITEIASGLRSSFVIEKERKRAVKAFKKNIYIELDKISKYCLPRLNFERLLCSLLVYADCVEGMLFRECKSLWKTKSEDYKKLKYKTIPEILDRIDSYLPDNYSSRSETIVTVYDSVSYTTEQFELGDNYEKYNELPVSERAEFLRDLYTEQVSPEWVSDDAENLFPILDTDQLHVSLTPVDDSENHSEREEDEESEEASSEEDEETKVSSNEGSTKESEEASSEEESEEEEALEESEEENEEEETVEEDAQALEENEEEEKVSSDEESEEEETVEEEKVSSDEESEEEETVEEEKVSSDEESEEEETVEEEKVSSDEESEEEETVEEDAQALEENEEEETVEEDAQALEENEEEEKVSSDEETVEEEKVSSDEETVEEERVSSDEESEEEEVSSDEETVEEETVSSDEESEEEENSEEDD